MQTYFRGTKLSTEQAKVVLEQQLVQQARFDIFGNLPVTYVGRSANPQIKRKLIGDSVASYYPMRNRISRVYPQLELRPDNLKPYISRLVQEDASKATATFEGAETSKKAGNVVSDESRQQARFRNLMKQAFQEARDKQEELTEEELIRRVIQQHFITEKDVKLETAASSSAASSSSSSSSSSSPETSAEASIDAEDKPEHESGSASLDPTLGVPRQKAQLPPKVLLDYAIRRAVSKLQASQQAALQPSSPLAQTIQKSSLSPEHNLKHLLFGPHFTYSSPDERYLMDPHLRPLTASQLAQEAQAQARREKLVTKFLQLAPHELNEFITYCSDVSKSLYKDAAQQSRFAAALKTLSDPDRCMELAELELAAENADAPVVRLVVTPSSSIAADSSAEAVNAAAQEKQASSTKALHSKLLTRENADDLFVAAFKSREGSDKKVSVLLDKFYANGPTVLNEAEQDEVLNALMWQLEQEDAMLESVEETELALGERTMYSLEELKQLQTDVMEGAPDVDSEWLHISSEESLSRASLLLKLSASALEEVQAFLAKDLQVARSISSFKEQIELAGDVDVVDIEVLTQQRKTAKAERVTNLNTFAAFLVKNEIASSSVAFVVAFYWVNLFAQSRGVHVSHLASWLAHRSQRLLAKQPMVPIQARHWAAAASSGASSAEATFLAAVKLWSNEQDARVQVHEPYLPQRRRLIALRHQVAQASSISAKLDLFFSRHQAHQAELEQTIKLRGQQQEVVNERATLAFLKSAWKSYGGMLAPEEDRWERHVEILKDSNKYTPAKKGQGKRSKKK